MRNPNEKLAICLLLATSLLTSYSLLPAASAATPDFIITANPNFLPVFIGGTAGYTQVYLASQNAFTGSVTVTSSVTAGPKGLGLGLTPSSTVQTVPTDPAMPATFTLHITARGSPGIYTLTITGVSASASHSATVYVVVSPPLTPRHAIIGGTLVPVNKLLLLSPFIALIGVAGAVFGFVYVKRKDENL